MCYDSTERRTLCGCDGIGIHGSIRNCCSFERAGSNPAFRIFNNSLQEALDLIANGFIFTKYLATEELETSFIKEAALQHIVFNIKDI